MHVTRSQFSVIMQKKKMKRSVLFVLLLLTIWVQAGKEREVIGCQPIYEHRVFMSTTEVTNFEYKEFLFFRKKEGVAIDRFLPDTTVWREKLAYNEPYVDYYFRHPAYRDYPVVGVSKDQATAFCVWLGQVLTDKYQKDDKSDIDSVIVRLPTKREWINAAKGGNDYYEYPWKGHNIRWSEGKWQGDMRANCVQAAGDYMGVAGALNDHADVTAPVKSYWPNDYGLYNCAGNVSELVYDDAVAMGGSWRSYGNEIKVTSEMNATEPSSQIGFRYLVEVVKLKPEKVKSMQVDKKFVKHQIVDVRDSLMISAYEVSNQLYNLFLSETNTTPQDTALWDSLFIYSNWYTCNYRWHSNYANFPAVGMTRKSVEEFCFWLTGKLQPLYPYPIQVDLPTEEEWDYAARGGLELSPYPWGGPYLRNSKGCLLANFRYVPDAFRTDKHLGQWNVVYPNGKHNMFGADEDGALACAAIDRYHPNGYGAHNMAGNVRELIKDNPQITKGGGWNSIDYYVQIGSREKIEFLPAADIGFRFVVRKL